MVSRTDAVVQVLLKFSEHRRLYLIGWVVAGEIYPGDDSSAIIQTC